MQVFIFSYLLHLEGGIATVMGVTAWVTRAVGVPTVSVSWVSGYHHPGVGMWG